MSPCVIVDIPHTWTPWVRQTLLAADEIVIVASPCLGSLRNGKAFVDVLRQNRPNDALPKLVLNQLGVPRRPEIPVEGICFGARPRADRFGAVRAAIVRRRGE